MAAATGKTTIESVSNWPGRGAVLCLLTLVVSSYAYSPQTAFADPIAGQGAIVSELSRSTQTEAQTTFTALRTRALEKMQSGQPVEAARLAALAFQAAESRAQKRDAARLAAAARYGAGQHVRAEWWLRRAANYAVTPAETAQIRQDFNEVRRNNPWRARLDFNIAPSDNINGGAREEIFYLDEFAFLLSPDSLALSGVQYSAEADLSFRLSESMRHRTTLGLYLYGRTFSLSSDARASAPHLSGSDYALTLAELSLSHQQFLFDGLGHTGITLAAGRAWYGGDPLWQHARLSLSQAIPLGPNATATVQGFVENQDSQRAFQPNATIYDLRGIYSRRLANNDLLQLSLGHRWTEADIATYTHTNPYLTVDYALAQPVLNTRLSLSLLAGQREYEEFSLSLNGRHDDYVQVGATAIFNTVSFYGFSPTVSVTAARTWSTVSRFSTSELRTRIGVQSNF